MSPRNVRKGPGTVFKLIVLCQVNAEGPFCLGFIASMFFLAVSNMTAILTAVNDGGVNRPVYKGWIDCGRQVYSVEGIRGLYQGVTPNIWGAGLSWGLYFFL